MNRANNNISRGRSSRYCFFSTCLPPTLLHLWRSCALKLVHPLCCDAVSETFHMSIDSSLTGSTLAACQADCGPSVLGWQVLQFLHIILPNHTYSGIHRISEHRKDSLSGFLCEVLWQRPHTQSWSCIRQCCWIWRVGNAKCKTTIISLSRCVVTETKKKYHWNCIQL